MHHLSNWQRVGLPALITCVLGVGLMDANRQTQFKRDQFDGVFVACESDAQLAVNVKVDCATMFNANASLARKDWLAVGKKVSVFFLFAYACAWLVTARKWQAGSAASKESSAGPHGESLTPPIANPAAFVGSRLAGCAIAEAEMSAKGGVTSA